MLTLEKVKGKKLTEKAKELYLTAFPADERMPFFMLMSRTKKKNVDYFAVTEYGVFRGTVYIVRMNDIVYIFYLAVSPDCRNGGYGSQILTKIKEQYPHCRFVLNIETTDEAQGDDDIRTRRCGFYYRNGFKKLDYKVKEGPVVYDMLCIAPDEYPVTQAEYTAIMRDYLGPVVYPMYRLISRHTD